jgi:cellulose synthase/poly-beta-1,6-N-acetylglucosamine synthase-like glycosyltransferase
MPGARLSSGLNRSAKPQSATPLLPFVSIIVPVRNEAPFIEQLLVKLLRQKYEWNRFEILVADGQSTDGTRDIVARLQGSHPNLRLVANPKQLSSAGRNLALQVAVGEIILLVDGHCHLDNDNYLLELADAFALSGADCIGRPQPLDVPGATTRQRAIAAARASWLGHQPASYIYSSAEQFVPPQSVAVAYRRSVFDTVGLFDESFDACEDVEFNHRVERAGYRCYFTPRVQVNYFPRTRLSGLFQQMVRYGQGRVRLLRKSPETFALPCFLPAFFLLAVILGPLLALVSDGLGIAYLAGLGLYAATILVTSLGIVLRKRDGELLPWLPLVFPLIHFGAGLGLLREWMWGWGHLRNANLPRRIPAQSQNRMCLGDSELVTRPQTR